tara:strand:+ start:324 stop:488 length:165 start_codon:yes stop_codon:yes gene_type:complete
MFENISLYVNGNNNIQTNAHLKKFRVSGGTSNRYANLPIIKLTDQISVVQTNSI